MPGKITITVESETLSTQQLEDALHAEIGVLQEYGFSNLNEAEFHVVPNEEDLTPA